MEHFFGRKDKVIFVMGAAGTGKSRLAIDLATRFPAEVVNSDKTQVFKGLDIVTNKVTEEECRGVPHHLLGFVDPDAIFTSADFRHHRLHRDQGPPSHHRWQVQFLHRGIGERRRRMSAPIRVLLSLGGCIIASAPFFRGGAGG
ncbi:hypothetical protein SLE2022_096910 [Rubroshorea leprosula]